MLRALLAKDLRRAWRNPMPWLINLALPICITALIGLVFGGKSSDGGLGRIRFAMVDEDRSPLTSFLNGAAGQGDSGRHLDPVALDRATALRQINQDQIAAAIIIPTNFTRNYLTGRAPVSLELIKNPAQSIHPAVLEELLGVVTTGLNAIARNFQSEFPEWQAVLEGKGNYRDISTLIERAGRRLEAAKDYINPPLVWYEKNVSADKSATAAKSGGGWSLFGFLLIGMAAMFLIFLASNGLTDLYREIQQRTFERYQTMRQSLLPFVAGKVLFAMVLLWLGSAAMLGGGALIFRIHWPHPWILATLTVAYSFFATGLMAVMVAWMPDERRAGVLINIVGMFLAFAGGCAFPPDGLPVFLREHITPHLPTYWFVQTLRRVQFDGAEVAWGLVFLKLLILGLALIGLAAFLFRRRFKMGLRA